MKLKRCSPIDARDVIRILKDDSVFPNIYDDGTYIDQLDTYVRAAIDNPAIYFLMPNVNSVFMFIPANSITFEIHTAIIKGGGREKAVKMGKACAVWMFENTPVKKFITKVPKFNRPAAYLARRCGMSLEGTITQSFMKNGVLYDEEIFGATHNDILIHGGE